jgi:hypothetical protein
VCVCARLRRCVERLVWLFMSVRLCVSVYTVLLSSSLPLFSFLLLVLCFFFFFFLFSFLVLGHLVG